MQKPSSSDVLIIVDVQNDFLPEGRLPVPAGREVIAVINRIAPLFPNVVMTQDWHPRGHISFASSHPQAEVGQTTKTTYGDQMLWPDHCVQGTSGAQLAAGLDVCHAQLIIRKGFHQHIDSYSAFIEADRYTHTGLASYLKERGITHCYVCGLATDFCVSWTAQDARALGFEVTVINDACRGINVNGSLDKAWEGMFAMDVERIYAAEIAT